MNSSEDDTYQSTTIWNIIVFAAGIIFYLEVFAPQITPLVTTITCIIFILYKNQHRWWANYILMLTFFIFGMLVIALKTQITSTGQLPYAKIYHVTAKIDNKLIKDYGEQIEFSDINIKYLSPDKTPQKLLLSNRIVKNITQAQIGDRVEFVAKLEPLPKKLFIEGYDFARHLRYRSIGATGYILSQMNVIEKGGNDYVNNFRYNLSKYLVSVMGEKTGYIASALMVGEYSGIDKNILNDIRVSGLAHILAVSGMHMSLVAVLCFLASRYLIIFFLPRLLLKYDVKKFASILSFIGTIIYLLISGAKVAALRAFIMNSIIIYAIIMGKKSISLYTLFIAAFIILTFQPHMLMTPSFQMSFAAVFALISYYNKFSSKISPPQNFIQKIIFYFIAISISSSIATFATFIFTLYHFNQINLYGIFSNLIMLPLISFIIMPLIIISFIAYILGYADFFLWLLIWPLNVMPMVAAHVHSFPHANIIAPHIPGIAVILFLVGIFILTLNNTRKKYIGLVFFVMAIMSIINYKLPNFIILADGHIIHHDNKTNQLSLYGKKMRGFKKDSITRYFGKREFSSVFPKNKCHIEDLAHEECPFILTSDDMITIKNGTDKQFNIPASKDHNYSIWIKNDGVIIR